MKLYEIANDLREVLELAANTEDDNYKDTLEMVQFEFAEKAEGIALYIKELLAEAEAIKAEEKVLEGRRKAKENKAERLKQYLDDSMKRTKTPKLETSKVVLSYRKSSTVNIINQDLLPEGFTEVVETLKIDKKKIADAIKQGNEVPGAELVENRNLQIK